MRARAFLKGEGEDARGALTRKVMTGATPPEARAGAERFSRPARRHAHVPEVHVATLTRGGDESGAHRPGGDAAQFARDGVEGADVARGGGGGGEQDAEFAAGGEVETRDVAAGAGGGDERLSAGGRRRGETLARTANHRGRATPRARTDARNRPRWRS